jgi:flagellum-specific peptidoglycan hydrolase FlgJ
MITEQEKSEFLSRMRAAVQIAKEKGAILNEVAVISQAAHESAWGTSELAQKANNLFGVKATQQQIQQGEVLMLPTWEWSQERGSYRTLAYWTRYPSWNECLVAYSKLVSGLSWFRDSLPHADPPNGDGNAVGWLKGLMEPGKPDWATDPKYVSEVSAVAGMVGDMLAKAGRATA